MEDKIFNQAQDDLINFLENAGFNIEKKTKQEILTSIDLIDALDFDLPTEKEELKINIRFFKNDIKAFNEYTEKNISEILELGIILGDFAEIPIETPFGGLENEVLDKTIKIQKAIQKRNEPHAKISGFSNKYNFYLIDNKNNIQKFCFEIFKMIYPHIDDGFKDEIRFRDIPKSRNAKSLKVYNIDPSEKDKILTEIKNIFFTLSLNHDLRLNTPKRYGVNDSYSFNLRNINQKKINPKYPKGNLYPSEPIGYYLDALRSDDPILNYMFFYQILEYYINEGEKKKIRNVIEKSVKRRDFHVNQDEKINNISEKITRIKKANETEEKRLKTLLEECIDEYELIEKINEIEKNSEENIYTKPDHYEIITSNTDCVTIQNRENHVISNLATRIYKIRCGIVHGKKDFSEQGVEIVPSSKSRRIIRKELGLLRWIVEEVIMEASRWV